MLTTPNGKLFTRIEATQFLADNFGLNITVFQLGHWASKEEYRGFGPPCIRIGKPTYYDESSLRIWARRVLVNGIPTRGERKARANVG